jgi:UDP-N-acetyl-D-galactosamine dehydrogenase
MLWKIDTELHVVVIGLGYVGLPTAITFSKKYQTTGIDINLQRIHELNQGKDKTNQFEASELLNVKNLEFAIQIQPFKERAVYIVTVPTPINENKCPDLSFLINVSTEIAKHLKKGDLVIYESTTYPGCTEEVCIPILEKDSKLVLNADFGVGYSPERMSPGDGRNVEEIVRITSGTTPEIAEFVNNLYQSVLKVETFKTDSIKIAEAAKLVENCQRDVNISFMNELALLFDKMNLDTRKVIEAASTKWNFMPFKPGLVGGHCISVDPYYLIEVAKKYDYNPELIGAGRVINDGMGIYVAQKCLKLLTQNGINLKGAKALILGFAYKANCSDFRNTKVYDMYKELCDFGLEVDICDPIVDKEDVFNKYKISLIDEYDLNTFELVIHAVSHACFEIAYKSLTVEKRSVVYDCTSTWTNDVCDGAL